MTYEEPTGLCRYGEQGPSLGFCLLEVTGGRVPKTAPAAGTRGGGRRLGGDEVQVLIIRNLIQVIPILEQLAAHILAHLLRAGERENCKLGGKAEVTAAQKADPCSPHRVSCPCSTLRPTPHPRTIGGSAISSYLCLAQQRGVPRGLSQCCPVCTVMNPQGTCSH